MKSTFRKSGAKRLAFKRLLSHDVLLSFEKKDNTIDFIKFVCKRLKITPQCNRMEIVILLLYLFLFCSSSYKIISFANAYALIEKDKDKEPNEEIKPFVIVKYEDKYVDSLQNTLNTIYLSNEDQLSKKAKYEELLLPLKKEIDSVKQEIAACEQELADIDDDDFETNKEVSNKKKQVLNETIVKLKAKLDGILEQVEINATQYANGLRLERLATCYLFETTPLGNLIMRYNNKRETFEYYSDCSIPYRYLETACRKYVITYKCRPLYIDMGAELKDYEQKLIEKENDQKLIEKENEQKLQSKENDKDKEVKKKSVFAKFKSYNTESGTGRVNTGAPSKNNIQSTNTNNRNEKVILKENANRYSYQGKINNFSILIKVDKKLVNKKYKMSFADFKKQMKL